MRKYLFVCLLFTLLSANVFADLEITVDARSDWGNTSIEDIKSLCGNVVSHFQEHLSLSNKVNGELTFVQDDNGPVVYHSGGNNYRIGLTNGVDGYYQWCAMTYEIAHEFCHIIHNFNETSRNNLNLWFQEVLAQTANIWAIQRMSETWETRPMKRGLEDYSTAFYKYASFLVNKPETWYSGSASEWLEEWEIRLRAGDYANLDYDVITQLSYKLLPVFANSPEAWNALRHLPTSSAKMGSYIRTWHRSVESEYKIYVENIAEIMGIDLILEDANEDYVALTFTHESTNSLFPTNDIEEWDGWIGSIWEKTPDGTIGNMPHRYLRFAEIDIWAHWMYSHAPGVIEYDINGKEYNKFSTYFGFANPSCGGAASMQFIAHADNVEIYRSKELYLADHGTYIQFDIPKGTRIFAIEIDDLGNNGCDHYVLGEPKLFYTSNTSNNTISDKDLDIDADVNDDGYVDLYDVMIVRSGMSKKSTYDTDVNNDGATNILDLLIVKAKAVEAIVAAAPRKRKVNITTWGAMKRR